MKTRNTFLFKTLFKTLLMLCYFAVLLSCGNSANKKSAHKKEQVIAASLGAEPSILDAAKASDRYSFVVLDYINENLTNIETADDATLTVLPGIAETWEHNSDYTEWVFHLRQALWSDGKKITADHFVYSIKRIINKESASPMAMYYDYIKNADAILKGEKDYTELGITAIDENTLKITTEYPIKNLDEFAAKIPPQRKDIVEKFPDSYGSDAEKIICSGAFKVKEWIHNSKIELIKNENFWNAKNVKLKSLTFKIIRGENAAIGELLNGSIDIARAYTISWIDKLKSQNRFTEISGVDSRVRYVFMNQKDKLFSNRKIRQAVSASLNRDEICKDLFDNIYKPAYGFVALSTKLDNQNYRSLAGEPIKKLLENVGDPKAHFIKGMQELGLGTDPSQVTISIMFPSNESSKFDEYLQSSLTQTLGVNVVLDKVESTVFKKRNRSLEYQIGFKSWAGGVENPSRYLDLFLPGNRIVPTGWENDEYTRLVLTAKKSADPAVQLENYKRAEELLLVEDCCIAPYANQTYNIFVQPNLKNVRQFYLGTYNLKYAYIE